PRRAWSRWAFALARGAVRSLRPLRGGCHCGSGRSGCLGAGTRAVLRDYGVLRPGVSAGDRVRGAEDGDRAVPGGCDVRSARLRGRVRPCRCVRERGAFGRGAAAGWAGGGAGGGGGGAVCGRRVEWWWVRGGGGER